MLAKVLRAMLVRKSARTSKHSSAVMDLLWELVDLY